MPASCTAIGVRLEPIPVPAARVILGLVIVVNPAVAVMALPAESVVVPAKLRTGPATIRFWLLDTLMFPES